ncbi:MAG TPA: DUF262 domain-containing HNH endonuclease family protein [Leptospiraceae bacterium]|nr:DUF262 domain-containing HNH endonuclease family protein [Leptospiraceae bacterium]HMX31421.1 DUF262 domain-containing HNH endonuclease family protein [Leptospiraceae bacterium]HMY30940.1 DUF262 domain-containing HNH endonuclease family protein [Leptospiraceae bacterium]HMZ63351.1 DUF262 domain-containing HNH endonuclease family protein [Leptospiraceae bacterium]HNA05580.1 DUF262 domain-containing HNH endonuclease family protein [Leptospiraceae bacterium]
MSFENIFKPEAKNLKSLFGNVDSFYEIPDYQRPYSWEKEQIEELWDDIIDAWSKNEDTYFLGSMILIKKENKFLVIDGQQRLTTLTILFCVLRDLLYPKDRTLLNLIKSQTEDEFRLRLVTQIHRQNHFEKEILKSVDFTRMERTNRKELSNYEFACLVLKEKILASKKSQLDKIITYLYEKVVILTIIAYSEENAVKLFQVLNTRGLDINNYDLYKGYLMEKIAKQKKDQFIQNWINIERISEDTEEHVDNLLTYYAYYKLNNVPKTSIYIALSKNKKLSKEKPEAIVYDFLKFSESYKRIYNSEKNMIHSFFYLPYTSFWKSILTTIVHEKYPDEKIYFLIRKLFYLYWISGVSLSKLKHIVMELILMIKGKKKINEIEKFIHTKLKEDNIKDLLKISLTTDVYDTKWIKPLLILLEYSMHDNNVAFIELGRYFYIEHLLPEKWNRKGLHWSKHWNEEDANNCLNKLGNLTLSLGKKDTIELNRDFDDKKKNYKNLGEFAFSLTRELLDVRQWKSWDQNHFKKRQELLLGRVRNLFDFDF